MRIVFDTNIFISALILPSSFAEKAILKVIEGSDELIISHDIIDEVLTVLSNKFSRNREALSRTAINLAEIGRIVKPTERIGIFQDEPDNRILECATAGKADAIVTGDKEMLKLGKYGGIKIITLKDYLAMR
ncbi:MAG: putative toxin-antitoxin system toxin component, PIN family [Deltaproteobacteria bacterium RIFCSPLOWO2_12_FULL_43_16]|nr:MAG: putative toxin-antitoxin system toxin component, PIN family [Deltaproteobacteria bacterium GWA2_43_19]OGQ10250.1 MAG: putative toxin-antitoxin system toxin component, PIN family [Deltaproteobacteria bacterium RIFCSPHIGHO2_02_FULL_43_33]OGQ57598.1 MAG: putative toxin-antitoxin system toxin component, PIN family [Deltaproteobacteria bacterium RIFCSPLOWO2_12_FULL_43_16]